MNMNEIINKSNRIFKKANLQIKKHSPEILMVTGVIGVVTSSVMACKATTKLSTILDNAKDEIDTIKKFAESPETLPAEYTVEDSKKDLTIVYAKTGVELFKLYAPAITLGTLSLVSMIKSNDILRKRNVAIAAAYATIDKSFKEYRGRVVERFGEELDRELKYNIKAKEIEETVVDEKGKEKKVKKTVNVVDPNTISEFARFFDDGCLGWEKDPEFNRMYVQQRQNEANEILKHQGYLFLNDVYDMLGMPKSKAGQVVGWIYDEKNPIGDNFVDFGIFDMYNEAKRNFVNGYERTILLDFNVDGNILDLM